MADRKAFLLRIRADLFAALVRWAGDETRSLNGQIEFLLQRDATEAGRLRVARDGSRRMPAPIPERSLEPRLAARSSAVQGSRASSLRKARRKPMPRTPANPQPAALQLALPRPAPRETSGGPPPAAPLDDSWDAMVD